MKVLNKLVKLIGYIGVYLLLFIEDYLISFVVCGAVMSVICSVYTFFAPLPYLASHRYGAFLLLMNIPSAVFFFILSVKKIGRK